MMPLESTSKPVLGAVIRSSLSRHLGRHFEVLNIRRVARKRGAHFAKQPVTDPCSRGPLTIAILEARP